MSWNGSKPRSLTRKLTVAVLIAIAVPMLAGGTAYLWLQGNILFMQVDRSSSARIEILERELRYLRETNTSVMDFAGHILADSKIREDREEMHRLIDLIEEVPHCAGARILNADGGVVISSLEDRPGAGAPTVRHTIEKDGELLGIVEIFADRRSTERLATAAHLLMDAQSRAEQGEMVSHRSELKAAFASILLATFALATVVTIFALRRLVLGRVQQIAAVAERVGEADFSIRCTEGSWDELGLLAHRINQMTDQLASNQEIQEERIRTRTRDLDAANRALTEALAAARSAGEARSRSLAAMSHEVRTPMSGVLGMAELLLETELHKTQRDYAEAICSCSNLILAIVNDILDLSKLEAGRVEIEEVDFVLAPAVGEIVDLLAVQAERSGLQLTCETSSQLPTRLRGDVLRIRQILLNLLGNAIKFTHRGTVTIRVRPRQEHAEHLDVSFSVEDTGIGIPADRLEAIFQPYVQAEPSTAREYGGTGLGLGICKHLCELMGGTIAVESVEGRGTRFEVVLPLRRTGTGKELTCAPEPTMTARRILLVEDNVVNQRIAVAILEKAGHCVQPARDGFAALEIVRHEPFDLILMDCRMPGMDGFETAHAIRAQGGTLASLPIVAMTADAMTGDREACLAAGMDEYLSKPIAKRELLEMVERVTTVRG